MTRIQRLDSGQTVGYATDMNRIAIVYWTEYGQTAKIAERLKVELGQKCQVDLFNLAKDDAPASTNGYDGVIVGSPVYIGKFNEKVIVWAKENAAALNATRSAFFSVSLNAADKREKARFDDNRLLQEFLAATGMKPQYVASFIGTVWYREYGFFKKILMKKICTEAGGPTDTSQNHELTDWDKVVAFSRAFLEGDSASWFATEVRFAKSAAAA